MRGPSPKQGEERVFQTEGAQAEGSSGAGRSWAMEEEKEAPCGQNFGGRWRVAGGEVSQAGGAGPPCAEPWG